MNVHSSLDTSRTAVLDIAAAALEAADALVAKLAVPLSSQFQRDRQAGTPDASQYALHGYAWMATYVQGLRQILGWARRLEESACFGEMEQLILRIIYAEYCSQLTDGLPMSQGEIFRPALIDIDEYDLTLFRRAAEPIIKLGQNPSLRVRLAHLAAEGLDSGNFGNPDLDDTQLMIRDAFARFVDEKVKPFCQQWHAEDRLIPIEIVDAMAEMGVFGLTIPECYGGGGMSKMAMAIVSEELSRGYIGVGSLGTRSEIAAELIRVGGTEEQKAHYLPRIATGEILPTAVFTEPNTGSDLGSLSTRAVRKDGSYVINGAKTWITHASRSDLMTLLARTGPADQGYRTLSMFLAEKPRGTDEDPFPVDGLSGSEIKVLGYRGMKEYELSFDGFVLPESALLGQVEGEGFKQLMATFESARVQTAARAVGVAQNALELGLQYALDRQQFGQALIEFPRVSAKIGWMVAETMMARQLTYFAAREKDSERRCDVEAGMAKLLAARVAWANADNALQIHGGNGYAEEYPISRVLCDARILNIFEGAAEIQAQVIARRLLTSGN